MKPNKNRSPKEAGVWARPPEFPNTKAHSLGGRFCVSVVGSLRVIQDQIATEFHFTDCMLETCRTRSPVYQYDVERLVIVLIDRSCVILERHSHHSSVLC